MRDVGWKGSYSFHQDRSTEIKKTTYGKNPSTQHAHLMLYPNYGRDYIRTIGYYEDRTVVLRVSMLTVQSHVCHLLMHLISPLYQTSMDMGHSDSRDGKQTRDYVYVVSYWRYGGHPWAMTSNGYQNVEAEKKLGHEIARLSWRSANKNLRSSINGSRYRSSRKCVIYLYLKQISYQPKVSLKEGLVKTMTQAQRFQPTSS
jgi:hypothetical protein